MEIPLPRPRPSLRDAATSPATLAAGLLLLGFLAAPWSVEHKAHLALHGLCAQRPSHSYWVGDHRLPFDARMMGIYAGFLASGIALVAAGAHRRSRAVTIPWALVLALLIGAMAVDGFNSLLLDMRLWHPYAPSNALRAVTGAGTGVALAVALCHLVAITVWRRTDRSRFVLSRPRELAGVMSAAMAVCWLIAVAPGWLYAPVAIALMLSSLGVLATLALVFIVLLRQLDLSFEGIRELQPLLVQAVVIGIVAMATLSAGRLLAERFLGATTLT